MEWITYKIYTVVNLSKLLVLIITMSFKAWYANKTFYGFSHSFLKSFALLYSTDERIATQGMMLYLPNAGIKKIQFRLILKSFFLFCIF